MSTNEWIGTSSSALVNAQAAVERASGILHTIDPTQWYSPAANLFTHRIRDLRSNVAGLLSLLDGASNTANTMFAQARQLSLTSQER